MRPTPPSDEANIKSIQSGEELVRLYCLGVGLARDSYLFRLTPRATRDRERLALIAPRRSLKTWWKTINPLGVVETWELVPI